MPRQLTITERQSFFEQVRAQGISGISHPEANRLPLLGTTGPEFDALRAAVAAIGRVVEPVEVFSGKIVDGRNRIQAALAAGLGPNDIPVVELEVEELLGGSVSEHVLVRNVDRRQLTAGQRAMTAIEWLPVFEAEAKKRQAEKKGGSGRAVDLAGTRFGLGAGTLQAAKRLLKKACAELIDLVRRDELSVFCADEFAAKVVTDKSDQAAMCSSSDAALQIRQRVLDWKLTKNSSPTSVAEVNSAYGAPESDKNIGVRRSIKNSGTVAAKSASRTVKQSKLRRGPSGRSDVSSKTLADLNRSEEFDVHIAAMIEARLFFNDTEMRAGKFLREEGNVQRMLSAVIDSFEKTKPVLCSGCSGEETRIKKCNNCDGLGWMPMRSIPGLREKVQPHSANENSSINCYEEEED